jgi:hypothetical protein
MSGFGTFALGVGAALVARELGPAIARRSRPVLRGAVKQALILGEGAQVRAAGVREDLQDLVAEARADRQEAQAPGARTRPASGPQVVK